MLISNFTSKISLLISRHPEINNQTKLCERVGINPALLSRLKSQAVCDDIDAKYYDYVKFPKKHIRKFQEVSRECGFDFLGDDIGSARVEAHLMKSSIYSSEYKLLPHDRSNPVEKLDTVSDLIDTISNGRIKNWVTEVTVEGTFFPALLLFSGWWNRDRHTNGATMELVGCNDLQQWLYRGFEQWAPSWEISIEPNKPLLLGQLADKDESDSILVIADSNKVKDIREKFYRDHLPTTVKITGTLYHKNNLPSDIASNLDVDTSLVVTDYCLVVRNEVTNHEIKWLQNCNFYTGYLWQCWIPEKKWLEISGERDPMLHDVYITWEHTNYGTKDALSYNLHSLNQKKIFIEKELGDELRLVQKSSVIVDGDDPIIEKNKFYQSIFNRVMRKHRFST